MNKENVNPNRPSPLPNNHQIKRLNRQIRAIEHKIKKAESRADSNGIMAEIKEIYALIAVHDDFIEFLIKQTREHPKFEQLYEELLRVTKAAIDKEKSIGKWLLLWWILCIYYFVWNLVNFLIFCIYVLQIFLKWYEYIKLIELNQELMNLENNL